MKLMQSLFSLKFKECIVIFQQNIYPFIITYLAVKLTELI